LDKKRKQNIITGIYLNSINPAWLTVPVQENRLGKCSSMLGFNSQGRAEDSKIKSSGMFFTEDVLNKTPLFLSHQGIF